MAITIHDLFSFPINHSWKNIFITKKCGSVTMSVPRLVKMWLKGGIIFLPLVELFPNTRNHSTNREKHGNKVKLTQVQSRNENKKIGAAPIQVVCVYQKRLIQMTCEEDYKKEIS